MRDRMPEAQSVEPAAVAGDPTIPFTCPWAQANLAKALDGMQGASSGVLAYGVGSRHLRYKDAAAQGKAVDYWMKMVEYYCGEEALPPSLTGRDTAFRVIERDV